MIEMPIDVQVLLVGGILTTLLCLVAATDLGDDDE